MTDEEVAAIAARAEAATPGEWELSEFYKPGETDVWTWAEIRHGDELVTGNFDYEDGGVIKEADAVFIAHARADIPALLAERAALRAALANVLLHFEAVIDQDEWTGVTDAVDQARAILAGERAPQP